MQHLWILAALLGYDESSPVIIRKLHIRLRLRKGNESANRKDAPATQKHKKSKQKKRKNRPTATAAAASTCSSDMQSEDGDMGSAGTCEDGGGSANEYSLYAAAAEEFCTSQARAVLQDDVMTSPEALKVSTMNCL